MAAGMSEADAIAALPVMFPFHNTPIPGALTLSTPEVMGIVDATQAFNTIIAAKADEHGIPLVDIHTRFGAMAAGGAEWSGAHYTTDFVTGGIFSLDGVHPANVGHAIAASWFAEVINDAYGSNLVIPSEPLTPRSAVEGNGRLPRFPQGYPALP